jgi:hypothetical protein
MRRRLDGVAKERGTGFAGAGAGMSPKLQWGVPEPPPPKNPYRDTLFVYGGLSVVIVVIAWATGGSLAKALAVALLFFVVASGWTIFRLRARALRADQDRRENGGGP